MAKEVLSNEEIGSDTPQSGDVCSEDFYLNLKQRNVFKNHLKIHNKWEYCEKMFMQNCALRTHVKRHTGEVDNDDLEENTRLHDVFNNHLKLQNKWENHEKMFMQKYALRTHVNKLLLSKATLGFDHGIGPNFSV